MKPRWKLVPEAQFHCNNNKVKYMEVLFRGQEMHVEIKLLLETGKKATHISGGKIVGYH